MINRPPWIPIGGDWLDNMPQGQDWAPPATPAQPVEEIRFRQVQGRSSNQTTYVVEYLYASVGAAHLGNGTATNGAVRNWVQQEVGRPTDDAGHIIGNNQGGLGTVSWNLFPQNGNFNRGVFSHDVERMIYEAALAGPGDVRIWFFFEYGDPNFPGRPTKFWYYICFPNGSFMNNDLLNP